MIVFFILVISGTLFLHLNLILWYLSLILNTFERDDPSEMPSFVAINEANIDGKIISKGDNLFSAIK